MFIWYERAAKCYVYMSDVSDVNSIEGKESQFYKARWHTRGWTLQELLAPRHVNFYTKDWTLIGTKDDLCAELSAITQIHGDILIGKSPVTTASVAQRMSWASRRQTSCVEDMAYCLMGVFSVNMTMLYGEGERAFVRLQEEICKESNDNSIFAWQNTDKVDDEKGGCGLLAKHPRYFRDAWSISNEDGAVDYSSLVHVTPTPIAMTNQGIRMKSYLLTLRSSRNEIRILVLRCRSPTISQMEKGHLGILIRPRRLPGRGLMYVRHRPDILTLSQHRPHLPQKIMLAKAGSFPTDGYNHPQEIDICRYELSEVKPEHTGTLAPDVAPVYICEGNFTSWRVIAWTAMHRLYIGFQRHVRKDLGRITFHRDDGENFSLRLGMSKILLPDNFFSSQSLAYIGEAAWVQGDNSVTWIPKERRVDCGDEHRTYVYADNIESDAAQKGHSSLFVNFTFLIRVSPHFRTQES